MADPILKVEGASISFGGVVAADDVSFALRAGEIKGLIGPNGAGKTTLLNLISGIYSLSSGSIWIDGVNVTKLPAYKRARMGLARTFQTPNFLDRSSIRDNLMLGTDLADQIGYMASYIGKKGSNFDEELAELMELAGFTFDWHDSISTMPFGQKKILELVRAMLEHPKILLIDEPAAGLNDIELQRTMKLIELATERGCGVILIEHRMDMVMSFCHNIIVLNFGRVIANGRPEEVSRDESVIEAYIGRDS